MLRRYDDNPGLAELGDLIDLPVDTSSSGMTMRLAFSISTVYATDVLFKEHFLRNTLCESAIDCSSNHGCGVDTAD